MLTKLLVIAAVIVLAWYLFKTVTRPRPPKPADPQPVERTVKCPVCGTYVPASAARNCGRDACPYIGPAADA